MCEATTIMLVGATAVSAYGQYQSGQSEADQARGNAEIMRARRSDALQRGAAAAGQIRSAGSSAIADSKVALAKGNVALDSPMALGIFQTSAMYSEQDAQTAKANAAREAWGYEVEEKNLESEAKAARRKSILGAAGTFLEGGAAASDALRKSGWSPKKSKKKGA